MQSQAPNRCKCVKLVPTNTSTEHDGWLNYVRHAMLNTPLIDLFTFEIVLIYGVYLSTHH